MKKIILPNSIHKDCLPKTTVRDLLEHLHENILKEAGIYYSAADEGIERVVADALQALGLEEKV